jgi:hypothetical protein
MTRKNIQLSSLNEDFTKIGLLVEDTVDSAAPAVMPNNAPVEPQRRVMVPKFKAQAKPVAKVEAIETVRISRLIQEAKVVLEAANQEEEFDLADVIKGYANVSLISDTLSQRFATFSESDAYDVDTTRRLSELANTFASLAEDAADSAEELAAVNESNQVEDLDGDLVSSDFSQVMEALIDGLDAFSTLTEEEEEGEEEEPEEGAEKAPKAPTEPPSEGKDD